MTTVTNLITQRTTPAIPHEQHKHGGNNGDAEGNKNSFTPIIQQYARCLNNNDSDLDKEYEDLDAKISNTRDNKNSYAAQLGGPVFDVYDSKEEEEDFPEQNFDPIFDVFDQDDTKKFLTYVAEEDVTEIAPIYDMFEEDEINQVTVEKVEDGSVYINESIYARETPAISQEDFATSNDVKKNFDLRDTTHHLQMMPKTSDWSHNYFKIQSFSTKEECFEEKKPEHVLLFDLEDKKIYVDAMNRHMSYDVWRKNFHLHMVRKPPDRARNTEHAYKNHRAPTNIAS